MAAPTSLIGLLLIWAVQGPPIEGVRRVAIPAEEHGYNQFFSMVIGSQEQLDTFLRGVEGREGWNNRAGFTKGIADAKLDFSKESLILIRHTEGSGSIWVRFYLSSEADGSLTARIYRGIPPTLTGDMKYYCFAIAVRKDRPRRVAVWQQADVLFVPGK